MKLSSLRLSVYLSVCDDV